MTEKRPSKKELTEGLKETEMRPHEETREKNANMEELQGRLRESEEQLQASIGRLKHLQADFENYKKRVAREQEEYAYFIEDRLLLQILPLYDSFERAFRSYNHNNDKQSFIEGMERIFAQFNEFLKSQNIQPIEALGQPFDPALHEALLMVEDEKPNIVLEEFERGYRRGERLLRPSRVKVSRKRESPLGADETKPKKQEQTDEGGDS